MAALSFPCHPVQVREQELIHQAENEGKPLFAALQWVKGNPRAPGSLLISYSTKEIDALRKMGDSCDFNGIRKKLGDSSINLGGAELVLKVIADEVHRQGEKLVRQGEKLEYYGLLMSTGSSVPILVCDCMRVYGDMLTRIYKKLCKEEVGEAERALFGKVLKQVQREHQDQHKTKKDADVPSAASFQAFAAALYLLLDNPEKFKLTLADAFGLRAVLVPLYKKTLERYSEEFDDERDRELIRSMGSMELKESMWEWYSFYSSRAVRNVGAHCAAWREGVPGEYERMKLVREMYNQILENKEPAVVNCPTLSKCALVSLDKYIKDKRDQEEAAATSGPGATASDAWTTN